MLLNQGFEGFEIVSGPVFQRKPSITDMLQGDSTPAPVPLTLSILLVVHYPDVMGYLEWLRVLAANKTACAVFSPERRRTAPGLRALLACRRHCARGSSPSQSIFLS